jgi:hypothetical protein
MTGAGPSLGKNGRLAVSILPVRGRCPLPENWQTPKNRLDESSFTPFA